MSMTDPIADLLTRIRNAQMARKPEVSIGASKLKQAVVKVLKDEGYVADYRVADEGGTYAEDATGECIVEVMAPTWLKRLSRLRARRSRRARRDSRCRRRSSDVARRSSTAG